jgi:dimethylamine/trimethylamine dehydrogenase
MDLIGAARPSIADPFLPEKISQGREDEIRECIGCNICRAANNEGVPLRCTQNPTIGEEWRRAGHPERIARKTSEERILIVGAGPAGLECALALGRRGYEVMLADAERMIGGRVVKEASLTGLSQWIRVGDYRQHMLGKLANVAIFRESRMTAQETLEAEVQHIVVATGSRWRRDGVGGVMAQSADLADDGSILTPDDVFADVPVGRKIMIYDDEHYFMGGALAETLVQKGHDVTLVTTMPVVSSWTMMTDEQFSIQKRLLELGVELVLCRQLRKAGLETATLACTYSGREETIGFDCLILVTGRLPDDELYQELVLEPERLKGARVCSVERIGDCLAPSSIADAVFSGHRYARELGVVQKNDAIRRERPI